MKHKKLSKVGLFSSLLVVPFAISFFMQYKAPLSDEIKQAENVQPPMTDKQKVLSSLLEIKQFNVDAHIEMKKVESNTSSLMKTLDIDVKAKGDVSNLEDVKLQGAVDAKVNNTTLKANIGYFENDLFLDYGESYFKLSTTSLFDFIGMLPSKFNLGISLPTEITDIDITAFTDILDKMDTKEVDPEGGYYFEVPLDDPLGGDSQITLKIVTDEDLKFSGIKTDLIAYNDMLFLLDVDLERTSELVFSSPFDNASTLAKYQNFAPALTLFDGVYSLTQQKKNTVNIDLNVDINDEKDPLLPANYRKFVEADLDLTYDIESEEHLFALDGELKVDKKVVDKENDVTTYVNKSTPFSLALFEKTIYTHIGDIALSVNNESLTTMIDYAMYCINDQQMEDLINNLTSSFTNVDLDDTLDKVNQLLGEITISSDELAIMLNTSIFSRSADVDNNVSALDLSNTVLKIKFDENSGELLEISITDFVLNNYKANLVVSFTNHYEPFSLDAVDYQQIDHLLEPMIGIYELNKDRSQFRLEFDATVSKDDTVENEVVTSYEDITVDGGLQFELDPERHLENHENIGYGYGDVTITDRKNVKHNIYADMKSVDELLMSYSTTTNNAQKDAETSPMYVKMKVQTMKDIVDLVSEVVQEQDAHFQELTGKLFDSLGYMPIEDIINNKDYTQLLAYNIVNSFTVGENYIEIDISLELLALEETHAKIKIDFKEEEARNEDEVDHLVLDTLHVSEFSYNGLNLEFNASLKEFNPDLASTRLSKGHKYIDFSDLKVLLRLGINTSKNNYYHFTAQAAVKLSLFSITINLPIDIKVWTKDGDVHVSVDFTSVPTDTLASVAIGPASGYYSLSSRSGSIYYHDGNFFVKRFDTCKTAIIFGKKVNLEYSAKYNTQDFMDNILQILLGDVIGLRETFMNQINDAISEHNDPDYQMKYEKILKDFIYNETGHYFYFDVDLAEIANNDDLKEFNAVIHTDDTNVNLTGVGVNLEVELVNASLFSISISVSADIQLADCSLVADDSNRLWTQEAVEQSMANEVSGYTNLKRI